MALMRGDAGRPGSPTMAGTTSLRTWPFGADGLARSGRRGTRNVVEVDAGDHRAVGVDALTASKRPPEPNLQDHQVDARASRRRMTSQVNSKPGERQVAARPRRDRSAAAGGGGRPAAPDDGSAPRSAPGAAGTGRRGSRRQRDPIEHGAVDLPLVPATTTTGARSAGASSCSRPRAHGPAWRASVRSIVLVGQASRWEGQPARRAAAASGHRVGVALAAARPAQRRSRRATGAGRRSCRWPFWSRNSARWKPSGSFSRTVFSITRGPAKPISALGSATTSPTKAKLAETPPIVGSVSTLTNGRRALARRVSAALVLAICISAEQALPACARRRWR